ncbi:hypothetical protein KC361_g3752 [Hortaea werneckii]|nr:hypothetical protein KC361_g3752 [Hortaea werneckii]
MEPSAHSEVPASGDAMPPAEESPKPPQIMATDVPQAEEPVATGKEQHGLPPQDEEVTARLESQMSGEETAGEPITHDVETSQETSGPPDHTDTSTMMHWDAAQKESGEGASHAQESAPPPKPRGRGRPRGRPPGRGRGASRGAGTSRVAGASRGRGVGRPPASGRGGGRGGKRKRDEGDDGDGDSSDSEVTTPAATMTKSGRNIQKRTSFAPPQEQSPTAATTPAFPKRKRPYRRNPELAVCKVCLRGTSPATNMIVFCDGCNTPYHRFCHHQPIDQSVIDEVDKEWYCKQCQSQRVRPVPESEVSHFVAAGHAPSEQRQRYFASLPQGLLITLLTKATTLHPDLPVFSPDFHARSAGNSTDVNQPDIQPPVKGEQQKEPNELHEDSNATTSEAAVATQPKATAADADAGKATASHSDDVVEEDDDAYPDHPPTYPRPGFGLMRQLPPDREDLQWLVEDDDKYGVFTHLYQVDSQAANGAAQDGSDQ